MLTVARRWITTVITACIVIILYTHICNLILYTHVFTASNSSGGASGIGPSASQTSLAPKRSDIVTPKHLQLIKWKDEYGETQKYFLLTEISPNWRGIGGAIGLSFANLDNIATEFHYKPVDCCRSVFSKWLDNPSADYPATWDGLINLLEDCELAGPATILNKAIV